MLSSLVSIAIITVACLSCSVRMLLQQADPPPAAQSPGPINVHIDLSGLANLIWQSFIDHIGDVGALWQGISNNIGLIGNTIWTPLASTLEGGLRGATQSVWRRPSAPGQHLRPAAARMDLRNRAYRAIATDRAGRRRRRHAGDRAARAAHAVRGDGGPRPVITHVTGRLIPAVFLTLAYPALWSEPSGC